MYSCPWSRALWGKVQAMGSHLGLFHVERFRRASAARMPRLAVWAGKRPGHSQRPPLAGPRPPHRYIMGPEAGEEAPAAGAWPHTQREPSGMWAALRIDSPGPAALPGGALSLAARVLCLPDHLLLLRLLCRGVFSFVMAPSRLTVGWSVQFQARISCLSPVRSGRIFRKRFPALPGQGLRQHRRPRPAPLRGCEPGGYCCAAVSPALSAVGRSSSRIGSPVCRR